MFTLVSFLIMTLAAIVIAVIPVTLTIVALSIVGAIRSYLRWLEAT